MIENEDIYHVYVGTYGDEQDEAIQLLEFNTAYGGLKKLASASGIKKPSYLTVNKDQNRLYAVSEVEDGEVVSFNVDLSKLKLTEINRQETNGNGPCFLTLDHNEKHLFTVNYGEGTITAHVLGQGGSIGLLSDMKLHAGGKQSHPHTIAAIPETNKYIVTDLGLDKLYVYEFEEKISQFVLVNEVDAVKGSGPRHLAIKQDMQVIYVVNEFHSAISVFTYDEQVENLVLMQEIETIPTDFKGENYGAHIQIAHSKSILYVSNRGHHSIAVYRIRKDGKLTLIDFVLTMGEWPRHFAITPDEAYLLVANEHTNSIVMMKIDEDGIPRSTGNEYAIKAPVCLHITQKK